MRQTATSILPQTKPDREDLEESNPQGSSRSRFVYPSLTLPARIGRLADHFADLVASEAGQGQASRLEQLADRLAVVFYERLLDQHGLGEPGLQLALGDFVEDLRRLAGVFGIDLDLLGGDLLFLGDALGGHV